MALWRISKITKVPQPGGLGSPVAQVVMQEDTTKALVSFTAFPTLEDWDDATLLTTYLCNQMPPECFPNDLDGCT